MFVPGLVYFLIPSKTNSLSIVSSSRFFAKIFHYNHGNSIELQNSFAIILLIAEKQISAYFPFNPQGITVQ